MNEQFFDCYLAENRKKIVSSLVVFGAEHFKEAYIIQNIETLKNLEYNRNSSPDDIYPFIKCSLIDSIRITMFFENFMKATLIDNKLIVHEISGMSYYKELKSHQHKKPISIKEFLEFDDREIDSNQKFSSGLTEKTISFSTLLRKKYFEGFAFPKVIEDSLKEYNRIRNVLHFNHKSELSVSKKRVTDLIEINRFVDDAVAKIVK